MSTTQPKSLDLNDNETLCNGLWILFGFLLIMCLWNQMGHKTACRLNQQTESEELQTVKALKAAFTGEGKHCVFVYATWCGHCNASKPSYDECAKTDDNVHFCRVNGGEESSQPLMKYLTEEKGLKIRGFPFFVCVEGGEVVSQHVGAFPKDDSGSMVQAMVKFVDDAFQ
jgi:hypothetical protein